MGIGKMRQTTLATLLADLSLIQLELKTPNQPTPKERYAQVTRKHDLSKDYPSHCCKGGHVSTQPLKG